MPKRLDHIHSYKGYYCQARPGDPPMLLPKSGTNCAACSARLAEHTLRVAEHRTSERATQMQLEAEWAEQDRKKTGSRRG
jgi:hypothetical protein